MTKCTAGPGRRAGLLLLAGLTALAAGLLTGCWDRVEIEDNSFVLAIGLDLPEGGDGPPRAGGTTGANTAGASAAEAEEVSHPLRLTAQIVLPILLPTAGLDGGGGQNPAWNLITASEGSVSRALREINLRSSKTLDLSHLQAIVLGEDFARRGIGYTLDYLMRLPEARSHTNVFVTTGPAETALAVQPKQEFTAAFYLANLTRQDNVTSRFPPGSSLGEVSRFMHEEGCFLLPWTEPSKDQAKLSGSAVFKDRRLIGRFDEIETKGVRWVMNRVKGGEVEFECPRHPGVVETMEINSSRTRLIPRLDGGGRLSFLVSIRVEGSLTEHQDSDDVTDPAYTRQLTTATRARIEGIVRRGVARMQELRVDGCFYRELERRYPRAWEQLKESWLEEVWPAVPVDVEAEVYIRRSGAVR